MITAQDVLDFLDIDLAEVNRYFPGELMTLESAQLDDVSAPFRAARDLFDEVTKDAHSSLVEEREKACHAAGYRDGWSDGLQDVNATRYDDGFRDGQAEAVAEEVFQKMADKVLKLEEALESFRQAANNILHEENK